MEHNFIELGISAKDIEVLALHYYEGQSLSTIGGYYGISKASVSDRIQKCLRILDKAGLPRPKRMVPTRSGERSHKRYVSPDYLENWANRVYYGRGISGHH